MVFRSRLTTFPTWDGCNNLVLIPHKYVSGRKYEVTRLRRKVRAPSGRAVYEQMACYRGASLRFRGVQRFAWITNSIWVRITLAPTGPGWSAQKNRRTKERHAPQIALLGCVPRPEA